MSSIKIRRINEDVRLALSTLLRGIKDPRIKRQGMITVTSVEVSGDLRQAKVFLSVYDLQSEKEFLAGLKSASGFIRRELVGSLGIRNTPELIFHIDKSIEHGARITSILKGLDPGEAADEDSGETGKGGGQ